MQHHRRYTPLKSPVIAKPQSWHYHLPAAKICSSNNDSRQTSNWQFVYKIIYTHNAQTKNPSQRTQVEEEGGTTTGK